MSGDRSLNGEDRFAGPFQSPWYRVRMGRKGMTIRAISSREGMTTTEVKAAIATAEMAGLHTIKRTRVGFRGQIIEMEFTE